MPTSVFGGSVDPATGAIAMWDGDIADIPSGWALCDGNNGTPNMLGRFAAQSGSPGTTGGADSVTLSTSQMPSHDHFASSNTTGSHSHTYPFSSDVRNAPPYTDGPGDQETGEYFTSSDGSHSHSVFVGSAGGGSSINNRPPYYELAFIMKL